MYTEEQVVKIFALYNIRKKKVREIADIFQCKRSTIDNILYNENSYKKYKEKNDLEAIKIRKDGGVWGVVDDEKRKKNMKYKITFTGQGDIDPLKKLIADKTFAIVDRETFMAQSPVYGNSKMKHVEHTFNIYELEKEGIVTIEEITE